MTERQMKANRYPVFFVLHYIWSNRYAFRGMIHFLQWDRVNTCALPMMKRRHSLVSGCTLAFERKCNAKRSRAISAQEYAFPEVYLSPLLKAA